MTDTEPTAPTTALELATQLGVGADEGVQIALFPEEVTEAELGEEFRWDVDTQAWPVWGVLGPWGRRLLDIVTEPSEDVKWWKVVAYAKQHGADLVPVRWSGSILDIPERYFQPGTVLGVRLFGSGPWFWPLEKPTVKGAVDPDLLDAIEELNESR